MSGASTLSDDEATNSLRGALFQGKLCEPQRAAVIPHGHTATHLQACLRDFSSNCSYGKPRGFEQIKLTFGSVVVRPWSVIRFPGQGAPDDVLQGGRPLWRGSLGGQRRWLKDQIGGKVSLGC